MALFNLCQKLTIKFCGIGQKVKYTNHACLRGMQEEKMFMFQLKTKLAKLATVLCALSTYLDIL